ncbi:hypothetical protein ACPTJE_18025, partial [Enterococcus faecalis]|uniref:hypothetical protein n=1 Tax=Enterococcus faecalis TaxID=1351 RepID=UPI003CC60806
QRELTESEIVEIKTIILKRKLERGNELINVEIVHNIYEKINKSAKHCKKFMKNMNKKSQNNSTTKLKNNRKCI